MADEADAPGSYDVEILLEYAQITGAPQAPLGEPFTIEVLPAGEDWWGPRITPQRLRFRLKFWAEFEGYLVVRVNGDEIAEKALRVLHNYVPDGMGT